MVKPKREKNILEILREQAKNFDEDFPVIATRWYVIEHSPQRRYHDGYDYTWSRESNIRVSEYFETKEEAIEWMDQHEPDEGKELRIRSQNLRRYWYEKWGV